MIPLTRPELGVEEELAVAAVLRTGMLVQGAKVAELEAAVASATGRAHAIALVNGTAALELALRALGVGPGDQVLCPSLTWPSPAHAVLACGAEPVLVDVDRDEWNMGPNELAAALDTRPKAAIAIDQFGNPSRVAELRAQLGDVPLIVDAACSLGSAIDGAPCGSSGVIACTSFHPRKVITTGEGGMCLTDDTALADAMRELRNHGQLVPRVGPDGKPSAPGFARAAGNERMSELAAAVGIVQMGKLASIVERRRALAARYQQAFADLPIRPQRAAPGAQPNHQTYGLVLDESIDRKTVIDALLAAGVQAGILSYALSRLPQLNGQAEAAKRAGRSLRNAEAIAERGFAIPLYPSLSAGDQDRVITAMRSALRPG